MQVTGIELLLLVMFAAAIAGFLFLWLRPVRQPEEIEQGPLEWCVAAVRYCDLQAYLDHASLRGWEVDTLDPYTDPRCEFDEDAFDGYRVILSRPRGTVSAV